MLPTGIINSHVLCFKNYIITDEVCPIPLLNSVHVGVYNGFIHIY
jgi:hypothetical protein